MKSEELKEEIADILFGIRADESQKIYLGNGSTFRENVELSKKSADKILSLIKAPAERWVSVGERLSYCKDCSLFKSCEYEDKHLKEAHGEGCFKAKCPHCEFIERIFSPPHNIESNREYWRMTEIFVYLHGGKDSCTLPPAEGKGEE